MYIKMSELYNYLIRILFNNDVDPCVFKSKNIKVIFDIKYNNIYSPQNISLCLVIHIDDQIYRNQYMLIEADSEYTVKNSPKLWKKIKSNMEKAMKEIKKDINNISKYINDGNKHKNEIIFIFDQIVSMLNDFVIKHDKNKK